nr:immunoglobulin light chain junction region [Macaca mulatta]MPN85301.1 immunoglobulin light chain junction region [Macaca mulatta]MPN85309.1 immunoglobulin light chain junction region [Macaca mulatta]MPN85318.1 immunoglobulin light chain junction region [Macaca mulatta]MPN85344.1 immunoglobulin light chain junction region [Macaca mulatta]
CSTWDSSLSTFF